MLNESQKTDLNNFNKAKKIALSIELNCRKRATAEEENPFYGANLKGIGACVIFPVTDQKYTKAVRRMLIEMDGVKWNVIPVAEWTILS